MAESAFPQADAANNQTFLDPFDPIGFPDDFPGDLDFTSGGSVFSDLNFNGDVEFSIDDLLRDIPDFNPDADAPNNHGHLGGGSVSPPLSDSKAGSSYGSGSRTGAEAAVSSPSSLVVSGSSGSGVNYSVASPDSGNSATVGCGGGVEVIVDEQKRMGLKRKKERGDDEVKSESKTPNGTTCDRSTKVQRSLLNVDNDGSPFASSAEDGMDEKRKVRLIRNRESAQLSRQRKKHYVEELEEKAKSLQSVITGLNAKINYIMAENVSLRQKLSGGGGDVPPLPPGVHPPFLPITPMHYPWVPGYALRPLSGSHVPLLPIPKLKPVRSASATKSKKSEKPSSTIRSKKADEKKTNTKTKKVASFGLLGILFFMFFVGGFVPAIDHGNGRYRNLISNGYGNSKNRILGQSHERVLSEKTGFCDGGVGCQKNNPENGSHPLLASLYVPRNDKLLKIDGNLIISSVLASEKAITHTSSESKSNGITLPSGKGEKETSLAIFRSLTSSLTVSKLGSDAGRKSHTYSIPNKYQKALPPNFMEMYNDNKNSIPADGPMKEWFHEAREGSEGPVFNSGMCSEVFQFDATPASGGSSGGIILASSIMNSSNEKAHNISHPMKMKKNRRLLHSRPNPLNKTDEDLANSSSYTGSKPATTMVVSVLVDPREAAVDGDSDGMMQPKSISRIFVVVLVDSVKYVTYSCTLPFKSVASSHLVN